MVFGDYLAVVEQAFRRKAELDEQIRIEAVKEPWCRVVDALSCLRGVSTLTGFALATEIGNWSRLDARTIGSYLGLVPSEFSSGQTRSQGGITKTGNPHVRRLLVEAAWFHAKPYQPARSPSLQLAWSKVPGPVNVKADAANRRLYHQWTRFKVRKKRPVVANTAVARQLAGFCHDLAMMV